MRPAIGNLVRLGRALAGFPPALILDVLDPGGYQCEAPHPRSATRRVTHRTPVPSAGRGTEKAGSRRCDPAFSMSPI